VKEAIQTYQAIAFAKNLILKPVLCAMPAIASCDASRMQQVLTNFLSNAIKFAPSGSSIVIETSTKGLWAQVSVSDAGPGIPDEQKVRVFERSSQLGQKDGRGLGLGLYISKWLIEAQQGKIGVENSRAGGSRFFFELPNLH